jgi:hypothetical protein
MSQAALNYNDSYGSDDQVEIPAGGIATFLTSMSGDWAEERDFPTTGIASVTRIADHLAKYGRNEDEYMVHAAEGETVVPLAVLNANPRLKEKLYEQMENMGLEPGQYIVGNELNSINPVTGQPEFFLKKLFKGLKKLVKTVFKVIVPIVATILLAPIMTPIGAAAFVSGTSTLLQGGNLKDALKSAAIGGATAGIFKGVAGGIKSTAAGGTFTEGVKTGLRESVMTSSGIQAAVDAGRIAEGGVATPVGADIPVTDISTQLSDRLAPPQSPYIDPVSATFPNAGAPAASGAGTQAAAGTASQAVSDLVPEAVADPNKVLLESGAAAGTGAPAAVAPAAGSVPIPQAPGFFEAAKDVFSPGGMGPLESLKQMFFPSIDITTDQFAQYARSQGLDPNNIMDMQQLMGGLKKNPVAGLGAVRRFAPLAAGTLALNAMSAPEEVGFEDPFEGGTGMDLYRADPGKYGMQFQQSPTYEITKTGGYYTPTPTPPPGANSGGDISYFPRKSGGIAGPGTGTSDDIPAMLSDGEFVMTAKAVRGAGEGSRKQGMQNMYKMMKNFEATA